MASDTSTPVFGLTLQSVGNNQDTWGDILNANLTRMEDVLVGAEAVSITGGDQDITLSASQYQNQAIIITGVKTGDNTVRVPISGPRVWVIVDATSGTGTVEFQTDDGTMEISGSGFFYSDGDGGVFFRGQSNI